MLRMLDCLGQPEVSDFEAVFTIDHDVRGVEIPVNHPPVAVQVPEDGQKRNDEVPHCVFFEESSLLALAPDEFSQGATPDDLHHDVEGIFLGE